jgi:hypothetical protein
MDVIGIVFVVGLACLAVAGIVAWIRPIEESSSVATRLLGLGVALVVVSLIGRAIAPGAGM